LKADATKLGLNFIAAHRDPGAPVITPAVINWRIGHFATLIGKERGLYHIYDPTFSKDVWVSESAIDSESSGYFLVKNQALPQGWAAVTDEVAGTVWGKGTNDGGDPDCTGGPTPDDGDDGGGGLGGADGGGDPGDPGDPDAAPPSPDDDPDADGDGDDGDSDCMARYSVY
jgi:hypothetical protein